MAYSLKLIVPMYSTRIFATATNLFFNCNLLYLLKRTENREAIDLLEDYCLTIRSYRAIYR